MKCELCGRELSPESRFCTGCGAPIAKVVSKPIKSHMTAAVLTTVLLGNWILGIPAIVFARECELAAEKGQTEVAERFSRRALTFLMIGSALSAALFSFIGLMAALGSQVVLP